MADWWASYIASRAPQYGLDPKAVLAVAAGEGLSGGVGDNGHAFGPFQLNDAGGVITGMFGSSQERQRFAESKEGIDFALRSMAKVAKGQKGHAAVESIIRRFERPADPDTSVRNAVSRYGGTPVPTGGGAPATVQQKIDEYLGKLGSPMAGMGHQFVAAGKAYGVDPRMLVAIGVKESGAGKYSRLKNNFANWGARQGIEYDSYDEAIQGLAKGLRDGYIQQGKRTPMQIAKKYASDGDPKPWAAQVRGVVQQIGASVPRELTNQGGRGYAPFNDMITPTQRTPELGFQSGQDFRSVFSQNLLGSMMSGDRLSPGSMLRTIMQSRQQASEAQAAAPAPRPRPGSFLPPSAMPARGQPQFLPPSAMTVPGGKPGRGIRELFYDPLGAYDEGNWIAPIGGHSDHVHVSFGTPQAALKGIKVAQKMGLRASENPYAEHSQPEPGVHTSGSYHYQMFPGKYGGWQLGKGLDVSGPSEKMARYFKKIKGMT